MFVIKFLKSVQKCRALGQNADARRANRIDLSQKPSGAAAGGGPGESVSPRARRRLATGVP